MAYYTLCVDIRCQQSHMAVMVVIIHIFFQVVGDILCMENSAYPTIIPIHSTYKIAMEWERKPHLGFLMISV